MMLHVAAIRIVLVLLGMHNSSLGGALRVWPKLLWLKEWSMCGACTITEMNRILLVLVGMHNRTLGHYLGALRGSFSVCTVLGA
jgi:hypothetical protein